MEQLTDSFGRWFDQSMQSDGVLPSLGSRFDEDAIVARRSIPALLAQMALGSVSLADLDHWAEQRWFAWKPFSDPDRENADAPDGVSIGLPLYVVERLSLFKALADGGWSDAELAAYADYEDEFVASILLTDRCPMPSATDEGVTATMAYLRARCQALEDEIGARRPRDEWPEGWHWQSRSSTLMKLNDEVLAYRRSVMRTTMGRLEAEGWRTFTAEGRYRIMRHVFIQAQWEEAVNITLLEVERRPLRAGVSWFLTLNSPEAPMRDVFGALDVEDGPIAWVREFQPDWPAIVAYPWCNDDEEELPIRLPGLILRNGQPTLTDSANPATYTELYRRWNLGAYFELHAASAGMRRCRHCHAAIDGPPTKRYCTPECSHAFRQATLRQKRQSGRDVASPPADASWQERASSDDNVLPATERPA